jgi:hypothetical protein
MHLFLTPLRRQQTFIIQVHIPRNTPLSRTRAVRLHP